MNFRPFVMAGVFAAALAAPMAAEAAAAHAVTDANLRTGPSTSYRALTVIPGGALVQIFDCSDWCRVGYRGYSGWVSASLVDQGGPMFHRRPPGPEFGFDQGPWWNDHQHGQRWHDRQNGFSFGFGFSG